MAEWGSEGHLIDLQNDAAIIAELEAERDAAFLAGVRAGLERAAEEISDAASREQDRKWRALREGDQEVAGIAAHAENALTVLAAALRAIDAGSVTDANAR